MPDISIREQLLLKTRKSPSIHFFQLKFFTRSLTSAHIRCRNVMSPLSEHPLALSVNCSSSFQHPWWNLCFNYLMFFIASFQFMIPRKPASISALACTAGRSGINDNATEGHSVLVLTFLMQGNVVACNGSEHLGIWCLQIKIINYSQCSFPYFQNLFCS